MTTSRVFAALQVALHGLFVALLGLAAVGTADLEGPLRWLTLGLCLAIAAIHAVGFLGFRRTPRVAALWLTALVVCWAILVIHIPQAAYLAFPLFFLCLLVLRTPVGAIAVGTVCTIAVVAIGLHDGWTTGGVVGPVVAALAAIAIGYGYRALVAESARRAQLIDELVATRARLAERERTAGRDTERARLAGEIHDTVAQGLSSIQMLLRAVERDHPGHPALESVALARRTAGEGLVDTRRFIAELRPGGLEGTTLGGALRRLARDTTEREIATHGAGPLVEVDDSGLDAEVPVPVASALLRIAQESVGNAVRHGRPGEVSLRTWTADGVVHLVVADDGAGFDPAATTRPSAFGLEGMRDRVTGLGGRLHVETAVGTGTTIRVEAPL